MSLYQKTVVILLSDKRSGSTMFQRELCRHPLVQTVEYSPHTYLETHHWLKGAVLLGLPAATFAGGRVYRGYGSRMNARTYLIDCVKQNIPEFQIPSDDRSLVFAGWDALCEKFAQPVFFEKSPQLLANWSGLSLFLEWINRTQYKVKVIGLVRNPLSVQYSAYQLFHTSPRKRQFSWLETYKNLLAFRSLLPDDTFYYVRYEEILEHPVKTFADICEFIGIPNFPEIGSNVHSDALTRWKDDPDFTLRLDDSVKQMAVGLGYSDDELDNPIKPTPPAKYRIRKWSERTYKLSRSHLKDGFIKPVLLMIKNLRQSVARK